MRSLLFLNKRGSCCGSGRDRGAGVYAVIGTAAGVRSAIRDILQKGFFMCVMCGMGNMCILCMVCSILFMSNYLMLQRLQDMSNRYRVNIIQAVNNGSIIYY